MEIRLMQSMKSRVRLVALILLNLSLPPVAALLTTAVGAVKVLSSYQALFVLITFVALGVTTAMINTKWSLNITVKIFMFLLFAATCAATLIIDAKIESDFGDKRLESMGVAYAPGQGFGMSLLVVVPVLCITALAYLLTQWFKSD
jgi:hypothetical protein